MTARRFSLRGQVVNLTMCVLVFTVMPIFLLLTLPVELSAQTSPVSGNLCVWCGFHLGRQCLFQRSIIRPPCPCSGGLFRQYPKLCPRHRYCYCNRCLSASWPVAQVGNRCQQCLCIRQNIDLGHDHHHWFCFNRRKGVRCRTACGCKPGSS